MSKINQHLVPLSLYFCIFAITGCSSDSTTNSSEFEPFIGLWTEKSDTNSAPTYESYIEFIRVSDQPAYNYYLQNDILGNCYTKELNMLNSLSDGLYEHVDQAQGGLFELSTVGADIIISYKVDAEEGNSNTTIDTIVSLVSGINANDILVCSE